MVATVRYEEIVNEKLSQLTSDESWLELEEAVQSGPVSGFGRKLGSILTTCFSEYDKEAIYFDESVRTAKRQQLESRALHLVHPAFKAMLGHLSTRSFDRYKNDLEQSLKNRKGFALSAQDSTQFCMSEFDQGCAELVVKQADWDVSKVREKLHRDLETHTMSVRTAKLSELTADYEKRLTKALAEPVESLFDTAGTDTWASIRKLHKQETDSALSAFSTSLSGFELDQITSGTMLVNLKDFARGVVEKKSREEAGRILIRMKDRFSTVFSQDNDSMPRVWTGKEDIRKITKDARAAALKLLSVMAAIRLEEKPDRIESILTSALADSTAVQGNIATDPLASSSWKEISPTNTLITPVQCKSLWRQFKTESEYTVAQAMSAQEAHRRNNSILPPPWALVLMAILGFNEFMVLLRNPLYLFVMFVVFLVSKALWVQLDVAGEFSNGMLPGLLSISMKLVPTVMDLLKHLAEVGEGQHQAPQPPQPAPPLSTQSYKNTSQRQPPTFNPAPDSSSSSTVSSPRNGNECTSSLSSEMH